MTKNKQAAPYGPEWGLTNPFETFPTALDVAESQMQDSINKIVKIKEETDWKKVSHTRRQRGYSFEDKVRSFFNLIDKETYFHARRLGGSSTGLPDLIITYNRPTTSRIVAMECKSVKDKYVAEIPNDQIYRCVDTLKAFDGGYNLLYVGFGFKFMKSVKCKRKRSVDRYWLVGFHDPYIGEDERRNLMKVTYDIRKEELIFWYADGGHRALYGNIQSNWYPDLYRLADALDPTVNHNERQIRQGRKQDTSTSSDSLEG